MKRSVIRPVRCIHKDKTRGIPTKNKRETATGIPHEGSVEIAIKVISNPDSTKGENTSEMAVESLVSIKMYPKRPKTFINQKNYLILDISG